ncbi:PX domain-containing protein [Ditylenchus destructor]|uniref:PX domain-containing protein n=1 Tax=Ditylenchus destructor TaxID=166010 RepID=A0AAD4MRT5_9BILA|nr:PX domain-containing protein [Ditylenchus destructor]
MSAEIAVRAYEKRGEGINAYLVYKIETKVSEVPGYTKDHFEVWRRFSDFLGLREKLMMKYQHKGVIVPLAPEKSISALTKTKLNSSNGEDGSTSDVADKRSRQLERFLRRIAAHEELIKDCDVRDFLSFDGPLPKAAFTSALSGTSMKKMFKSFGDVLSKLAFPMDENDRWFEQANSQVEELDEMLVRLHTAIDHLVFTRRELSLSDDQLSKALSMLASCEENTALARTLSKLAETHENLAIAERHEAEQDSQQLAEPIQEQLQLTTVLKEVFYERVKSWQNWQTHQQSLTRKREIKTRMDLAGKGDKAAQFNEEVKEAENKADQMEKEFLAMSKIIREEYDRYCKQRREDIKHALIEYLESMIESEGRVHEYWERFAPETKSIVTDR